MKIAISPSSQEHNAYTGGGTEEEWMRVLASKIQPALFARGHECRVFLGTMLEQIAAVNAWGADLALELHSNAGGGHGTVAYIHHMDAGIRELTARAMVAGIAALDPHFNVRGVAANGDYFAAIRLTRMPCILLETLFHDCAYEAQYIREHTDDLAQAIAGAFGRVASPAPQPDQGAPVPVPDVPAPPVQVPVPAPTPAPAPTTAPKPVLLVVDGNWGPATSRAVSKRLGITDTPENMGGGAIRRLQTAYGALWADGVVSGQKATHHLFAWTKDRVKIGAGGSRVIIAMASDLEAHGYDTRGTMADGLAGPAFVAAVQRRINADPHYLLKG